MKKSKSAKILQELLDTGIYLLVVLIITFLVVRFVGQRTEVDGESMLPTLEHQDQLLVDKISYRFHDPERFDIIVFPYPGNTQLRYIKRIIGLPGETVQIGQDGTIYINGEALKESYGSEIIRQDMIGLAAEPITLGADEYFVMGDNRNYSRDSRMADVGNIHRDTIIGKAWVRIWPLSGFGFVED
ncbi:MAG: signal peptidase I [Lachnospiraceae bacterium]|nr:signal peptidase I [Lachnospiraceae bacterium]